MGLEDFGSSDRRDTKAPSFGRDGANSQPFKRLIATSLSSQPLFPVTDDFPWTGMPLLSLLGKSDLPLSGACVV